MAALIYEYIWFRLTGLVFGNSVWAAAIVLASFMGGIALGNLATMIWGQRIKRPLFLYGVLEIIIAASALCILIFFPLLNQSFAQLFQQFLDQPIKLNSLRFLLAFGLLLVPTTAMGATLPVFVAALNDFRKDFGSSLGLLYGLNTLGAVVGVLVPELSLVQLLGIFGSGLVAVSINLIIALVVFIQFGKRIVEQKEKVHIHFLRLKKDLPLRILVVSFFSGLIFLALEMIWIRFMLLSMNAFSLFFAIILAVVLLGISIGGFVGSKLSKMVSLKNAVSYSLLSAGIFVILTYVGYIHIFTWVYSNVPKTHPFGIVITALFLACPIAICSGIVFPLLGQLIHKHVNNDAAATGVLTFCNTFGSMIGALVAGSVFVPQFGIETSLIILGVGYVLLAGSMFELKGNYLSIENTLKVYAVCIAPILIFFPHGTIEKYLDIPTKTYKQLGERRIAVREGLTETIQYLRRSFFGFTHYVRLITNGHPMSSTRFLPRRYMKMYVYLPVAIHPHIERAALICFGAGQTAKALTDTKSIEEIDFVDISNDVFRMSKHIFPKNKDNPVHDPRVTVHVEDGRFFLQTTKKKYDLITGEPPPPPYKGIDNLYTEDYFQLAYDKLNDQGIVTYWLPVTQMSLTSSKSILRGFCNVFEHCTLWDGGGYNWMMVGIKRPKRSVPLEQFVRQWKDKEVSLEMRALGMHSPEELGSNFIADRARIEQWLENAKPLTDNYPKRLSIDMEQSKKQMAQVYSPFIADPSIVNIFLDSKDIDLIWPQEIQQKTRPHFSAKRTIHNLNHETPFKRIEKLHWILSNPHTTDYEIFSLLNSDVFIQRILVEVLNEENMSYGQAPKALAELIALEKREKRVNVVEELLNMTNHLATGMIVQRQFALAVQFYEILGRYWTYKEKSYQLRLYLLFKMNEKEGAREVFDSYMLLVSRSEKHQDEMKAYWQWLESIFENGQATLQSG